MSNSEKPKRLFGLFRSKSSAKADPATSNLGSGTALYSMTSSSSFDPYSPPPNLQEQKRSRSKSVGREPNDESVPSSNPPPPPLPTIRKFASAHDLGKTASKLQRESIQLMIHHLPSLNRSKSSLSSKSLDHDDDDIPLGYLQSPTTLKHSSLLSDRDDEDDKDLLPIAMTTQQLEFQSAADKYKERVKEKLNMDDDDNTPISSLLLKINKI